VRERNRESNRGRERERVFFIYSEELRKRKEEEGYNGRIVRSWLWEVY
jgi:hypothetical protein